MSTLLKWTREGLRLAGLGLLQILILFWVAKLYYCAHGYFVGGTRGMLGALMHGMVIPSDLRESGPPRWDLLVLRLAVIAFITVTLGVVNRRTLAKFCYELRHGPSTSGRVGSPHHRPIQK
jgi:hypothetical protein